MTDLGALGLPEPKQRVLSDALALLAPIDGVVAVALGGSYARGTHRADSDIDIALYYRDSAPLAIDAVRQAAHALASRGAPTVTGLYEWGPWVNGGAWIPNAVCRIDVLYRSIEHVERTIEDAQRGLWQHHFDQQAPFGFRSVIYLAETASCVALHDPSATIAGLKARVASYPPALKTAIVGQMLWGCEFALFNAQDFAARGDVVATAGTLTRVAHYLVQALYAHNETYFIGDKAAEQEIARFATKPQGFWGTLSGILARPGATPDTLRASVAEARTLVREMIALTDGAYRPRFQLVAK